MKIFSLIKQPYPLFVLDRSPFQIVWRAFLTGLFIVIFLLVFQPFNISEWHSDKKILYLLGFGLVTFITLIFYKLLIIPFFFDEKYWTVGREIGSNFILLILITLGNTLYAGLTFISDLSFSTFLWSFSTVVSIGIFPILFDVLNTYHHQLKKYTDQKLLIPQPVNERIIEFLAENGKDIIKIKSDQLLFIESADNYANIVFLEESGHKKELIRSSLTRLENQIPNANIVRCHRSYIVNLEKVKQVSGNAQGYKLHLQGHDQPIPVARKNSNLVLKLQSV